MGAAASAASDARVLSILLPAFWSSRRSVHKHNKAGFLIGSSAAACAVHLPNADAAPSCTSGACRRSKVAIASGVWDHVVHTVKPGDDNYDIMVVQAYLDLVPIKALGAATAALCGMV
jgi:hypothetical protein